MAVTLYRQVGKGKARHYQKVNLGRASDKSLWSLLPTVFVRRRHSSLGTRVYAGRGATEFEEKSAAAKLLSRS